MIKKLIVLISIFLVLNWAPVFAAADFNLNLYYGLKNNSEVKRLQEFLTNQGIYGGPATGNFFSLTLAAVKKFQLQNGIAPAAGYFGIKSRATANQLILKALQKQSAATSTPGVPAPTSTPVVPVPALVPTSTPSVAPVPPPSPLESSLRFIFTLSNSTLSSYGEKLLTEFKLTADGNEKIAITRIRFKNLARYPLADNYLVTLKLVNSATNAVIATVDAPTDKVVEFKIIQDNSKPDKNVMVSGSVYYVLATILTPSYGAEKPAVRLDVESSSDITAVDFNDFNRPATITKNNTFPLVGPTISTF